MRSYRTCQWCNEPAISCVATPILCDMVELGHATINVLVCKDHYNPMDKIIQGYVVPTKPQASSNPEKMVRVEFEIECRKCHRYTPCTITALTEAKAKKEAIFRYQTELCPSCTTTLVRPSVPQCEVYSLVVPQYLTHMIDPLVS